MRIDGRIYRGATAGTDAGDSMPFIINDNAQVAGTLTVAGLVGTGIVDSTNLADSAVTSAKISDGTIVSGDLADSAVTSTKILNSTISTNDLADSAVTSAKIASGTIVNSDISTSAAITPAKISGTAWTSTNDGSGSGLDADKLDNVDSSSMHYIRASGVIVAGQETTVVIPHWTPFQIEIASGWPDSYGLAHIIGFENDDDVGVASIEYNGNATSEATGSECAESSTDTIVDFGPNANNGGYIKCPGEETGDHNLVIGAKADSVEIVYRVIY